MVASIRVWTFFKSQLRKMNWQRESVTHSMSENRSTFMLLPEQHLSPLGQGQ
jgi:hypothetical protein